MTTDHAVLRRFPDLQSMECMQATFVEHSFPRHAHDTYVIELVEEGIDRFFCKDAEHKAPAGSFVLINPLEVHTGNPSGPSALRYRSLYPTVEMMMEIQSQSKNHATIPVFTKTIVQDVALEKLFNRFWKSLDDPIPLYRQTLFFRFGQRLLQRHSSSPLEMRKIGNEKKAVQKIREYISDNYTETISLDSLSTLSGLSPFYLLRSFRKEIGLAPYEYLINLRIERSKKLLLENRTVAQVALETGFADQPHFTRFFKRRVGVTPGHYTGAG